MQATKALSLLLVNVLLSAVNFAQSADMPVYKDWVLTIPSVSTPDQVGQYQDLTFNYTAQGTWQLFDFKSLGATIGTAAVALTSIYKVDVIKTDAFPVQVFLRVSGTYNPCNSGKFGQINQRMENNRFDVAITANYSVPSPPPSVPVGCLPYVVEFLRTISLPVYGLSAGTYTYNVNGTTGTFALTTDNKYPGDY